MVSWRDIDRILIVGRRCRPSASPSAEDGEALPDSIRQATHGRSREAPQGPQPSIKLMVTVCASGPCASVEPPELRVIKLMVWQQGCQLRGT